MSENMVEIERVGGRWRVRTLYRSARYDCPLAAADVASCDLDAMVGEGLITASEHERWADCVNAFLESLS